MEIQFQVYHQLLGSSFSRSCRFFFFFFLVSKLKQHVHCESERASANISILMGGHLFKAVLTFPFHQIATPALKIHSLSGGRGLPLPHH